LLKLGIDIGQTSVAKYMVRLRQPPSQTWRTFLDNHLKSLVSVDFFTVPTARLRALFVLVVLAHHRRRVVHFNVTEHPTAGWTAQQIVAAFPDDRECLNRVLVLGERHLRRILASYFEYYHRARTHLSLDKDAPDIRPGGLPAPRLSSISVEEFCAVLD
jgi:hypothetical protein